MTLQCARTCPNGGGRPDCPIRDCAHSKELDGCWQCTAFETCEHLEPLCACHGDTHRHNLRMIRQCGVENWAHKRGPHYVWHKSGPQP